MGAVKSQRPKEIVFYKCKQLYGETLLTSKLAHHHVFTPLTSCLNDSTCCDCSNDGEQLNGGVLFSNVACYVCGTLKRALSAPGVNLHIDFNGCV